jgi:lysozyme
MRWWAWVLGGLAAVVVMDQNKRFLVEGLARARTMIEGFEGFSAKPYKDQAGHWTIGYGHLLRAGEPVTASITKDRAQQLLEQDMSTATAVVDSAVTVPLTAGQRAALISFAFNVGSENFQASTLLRLLNAGDYVAAADQFPRWDKYTDPVTGRLVVDAGLLRRRQDERKVFVA